LDHSIAVGYRYGTWPSRIRAFQIWDSKIWLCVLRDPDSRMIAQARFSSNCKLWIRPLVREGVLYQQTRNCLILISTLSLARDECLRAKQTDRLTVGRDITLTLSLSCS
jgi:hypothetical protein